MQRDNIDALERALGRHTNYYAIDGERWPPKAILRFPRDGGVVLATCGVGMRPQPAVEMAVEDPSALRRIELGMAIDDATFSSCGKAIMSYLSGQTNLPWSSHTWLGHGHTLPCDAFAKSSPDRAFVAVLLLDNPRGVPALVLPSFRGDPVNMLWAVPITNAERKLAMTVGSAALIERLNRTENAWVHRHGREPVA